MRSYPRARFDLAPVAVAVADEGIWWIDFAVEDDNFATIRNARRLPVIERPARDAVIFKTGAPRLGPVLQLALALHPIRQIGLLIAKACADVGVIAPEVL